MLPFRVLLEAKHELLESARQYRLEDLELARDFGAKYQAQLLRAREMPHTGHLLEGLPSDITFEVRRFLFERFKHALYVAWSPGEIVVIAVAHQHRRPFYWRKRLAKVLP